MKFVVQLGWLAYQEGCVKAILRGITIWHFFENRPLSHVKRDPGEEILLAAWSAERVYPRDEELNDAPLKVLSHWKVCENDILGPGSPWALGVLSDREELALLTCNVRKNTNSLLFAVDKENVLKLLRSAELVLWSNWYHLRQGHLVQKVTAVARHCRVEDKRPASCEGFFGSKVFGAS